MAALWPSGLINALSPVTAKLGAASGSGEQKKRTLPARAGKGLSPPPANDAFMSKLDVAGNAGDDGALEAWKTTAFTTPVRDRAVSRISDGVSPPGAPSAFTTGRKHSRVEQAREILENTAARARSAAAALTNALKMPLSLSPAGKAKAQAERSAAPPTPQPEAAAQPEAAEEQVEAPAEPTAPAPPEAPAQPVQRPQTRQQTQAAAKQQQQQQQQQRKPVGAAATAAKRKAAPKAGTAAAATAQQQQQQQQAKKKGAGTAAAVKPSRQHAQDQDRPKNAQTQAELLAVLEGTGKANEKAAAAAAEKAPPKKAGGKRSGTSDALVRHGYATQGPIAAGAFSTIVRAKALGTGLEVAVKSFDNAKCKKDYQHLYLREGELGALRAAKQWAAPSRWVANLIEEHVGPTHTYAILEYCSGGSLMRHLQKLQTKGRRGDPLAMPEAQVARLGAQVNAALRHLHRLDVAHRDLKPGNVLFYGPLENHLKLCDFGFAKRCRGQRLHTICGTPIYMAPELTQGETKKGYAGHPVDMWALGAMIYEMLHNRIAFNGVSEQQLYQRIRSGTHTAFRKDLSKEAKGVIKSLLAVDPTKRATAKATEGAKFFAGVDSLDDGDRGNEATAPHVV